MKNLKKLVSVILTVAMLISSIAVVGAADYNDVDATNSYYKAVKVLSGLGIVEGDDEGNFNPTSDIKRSEMITLVCRMMGEASIATATSVAFDDVADNHWAVSYIKWGVDSGIIKGVGDNKFAPDASVTYQDALVMILRALGYERIALRSENGGYPGGYVKVAKRYGVSKDITFANEKAATREVVAQAIYNALTTGIVETSSYANDPDDDKYTIYNVEGKAGEYRTILTTVDKIFKVKATVDETAKSRPETYAKDTENPMVKLDLVDSYGFHKDDVLKGLYSFDAKDDSGNDTAADDLVAYVGETDVADYLGYTVEAYIEWDNKLADWKLKAVVADVDSTDEETVTDNFVNYTVSSGTGTFEYYANINDAKTTKIEVDDANLEIYYNGVVVEAAEEATFVESSNDTATAWDDTTATDCNLFAKANSITFIGPKNGKYNKIFITDYLYKQVESVRAADNFIKFTFGSLTLDAEERNKETFTYNLYDADGNAITLEDVAEDDIFNIVAPLDGTGTVDIDTAPYMDIYVTNKTVTGSVSELKNGKYVIDGVAYDASATVSVGDEGVFFLTIDDIIFEKDASSSIARDFAFLLGAETKTSFGTNTATIRMWTEDGKVANYTVAATLRIKGADILYASYPAEATFKRTGTVNNTTSFYQSAIINETETTDGTAYIDTLLDDKTEVNAKANIAKRLVAYKLNSAGEISELIFAGAGATRPIIVGTAAARSYNEDINTFGGVDLDDSSKLIVAKVDGTALTADWNVAEDDIEIVAFSALDEDLPYNSFLYNFNGEETLGVALFDAAPSVGIIKSHLAVVTEIGTTTDADGMTVSSYTLLQGGEEITLKANYDEFSGSTGWGLGDVVQYAVNTENEIVDINTVYDANAASSRFNNVYNGKTYSMDNLAANKLALVYGITKEVKNGAMLIEYDEYVDTNDDSTPDAWQTSSYRARLNETEGNTYALVNKLVVARKQDITKLSSADTIKESYNNTYYLAIAVVNDDGRFEDVVQIKIDDPTLVDSNADNDGDSTTNPDTVVAAADVTHFLRNII